MKIICEKSKLMEVVSSVSKSVLSKSTIPALEGILMKADDSRLYLTGYDLEMGISTYTDADVEKDGQIVIPAKILLDIIRMMPSEEISITADEKLRVLIKGGATEYKILGINAEDYPEFPCVKAAHDIRISQALLKNMIQQTIFAAATVDSKPVHMGSQFEIENGEITIVSVDGYRLAMRCEKITATQDARFVVPAKTLAEVSRLIRDDENDVEFVTSNKHIVFKVGKYNIVSRLLEGEFLDYKKSIPKESTTVVKAATRQLMESVERTSLLISERLKSPIKLEIKDSSIKLSCATPLGNANDEVGAEIDGEELEMGFNNKYLVDALRAANCDMVRLELNGTLSPMKILPPSGEGFLFLVLPVRIK